MAVGVGGWFAAGRKPAFGALDPSKTVAESAVNAAPVQLDANVSLGNGDGTGFGGGKLSVSIAGALATDRLALAETGGITLAGTAVYYQNTRIGTLTSGGQAGAPLTIVFDSGPVSDQAATALARAVTYASTSDAPSAQLRAVTFQATDAENTTGSASLRLKITAQNDAPLVTGLDAHITRAAADATTAAVIDSTVSVANPDGTGFKGGGLTLHLDGATAGDDFSLGAGTFRISGTKLYAGNRLVGTVTSDGQDGRDLVIKFQASAAISDAEMTTLMRQVSHRTTDAAPPEAERMLTFTVKDREGDVASQQSGLAITQPARPPVAGDDSLSASEDTPLVIAAATLLANDTDPDGDTLSVTAVGNPSHGTVALANGQITFTPDADYDGAASFTYTVSDGKGGTDTASVQVSVAAVNDAPQIGDAPVVDPLQVGAAGQANGGSFQPRFSPDGTTVAFLSSAGNLVPGDTNARTDVFLTDLATGSVTRVSTAADGAQAALGAQADQYFPLTFSPDGTKLLFWSETAFVPGDTNTVRDLYAKDLVTGQISLVNSDSSGNVGNRPLSSDDDFITRTAFLPDGTKILFISPASNLVDNDTATLDEIFLKDLVTGQTTLVSAAADGTPANRYVSGMTLLAGGTKVLFLSAASNLVANDTNGQLNIFVKDITTGAVTLVSSAADGTPGNASSSDARVSLDGTKVLFESTATNLVANDTNGRRDLFVKDLATGTVTMVTSASDGTPANGDYYQSTFSADGTKVVFTSGASNLVPGDTNGEPDIFVKDLATGALTLVSAAADGTPANAESTFAALSSDGTKVLFATAASTLVPGDTNGGPDLFVKDLATGAVTMVTSASDGTPGNAFVSGFAFTPDGTKVVFASEADNLVPGDTNGLMDIFIKDIATGETRLMSAAADGTPGNGYSDTFKLSPDGTRLLFYSESDNLVPGDTNGRPDLFVKDLVSGAVTLVASRSDGTVGSSGLVSATFSPDGTKVLFSTDATGLLPADNNRGADIFVKDLATGALYHVSAPPTEPLVRTGAFTFSDADGGDAHTVSIVPAVGTRGTLEATVVAVADGPDRVEWTYKADPTLFATVPQGSTVTEVFAVTVDDGHGGTASVDISVPVQRINEAPVAWADYLYTYEDTPRVVEIKTLLANDIDLDGDALSVIGVGDAVGGIVSLADGTVTFTPAPDFVGMAAFSYTISDGHGGTASVTEQVEVYPLLIGRVASFASPAPDETGAPDPSAASAVSSLLADPPPPAKALWQLAGQWLGDDCALGLTPVLEQVLTALAQRGEDQGQHPPEQIPGARGQLGADLADAIHAVSCGAAPVADGAAMGGWIGDAFATLLQQAHVPGYDLTFA